MDYKQKYEKYKNKYNNLKNKVYGGDICEKKFQLPMDLSLHDKKYEIYTGSTNIDDPIEQPCDLDDLYQNCKKYLDTLNEYKQFILWCYTGGALARLLNNYLLNDNDYKNINEYHISFSIFFQIKWYFIYKINEIPEANELKLLFENILINLFDNIKAKKLPLRDQTKYRLNQVENNILTTLLGKINNVVNLKDERNKINTMQEFFTEYDENIIIEWYITYVLEKNKEILPTYIQINLDILKNILNNTPPIDRCIRLYKIIGKNTDLYKIGEKNKQKVINSLTCSRTANISIFYNRDKNTCCLLDIICKAGTKVLFLDYNKTAYGNKMYEVLLPPDYFFNVISSEKKSIITYEFTQENIKFKKSPKISPKISPIFELTYQNPEVKEIKTYLIEISDK